MAEGVVLPDYSRNYSMLFHLSGGGDYGQNSAIVAVGGCLQLLLVMNFPNAIGLF
jgi:hypothetical protein